MTRRIPLGQPLPDYPDGSAYDEYDPDRCPMCGDEDCDGTCAPMEADDAPEDF